MATAVLVMGYPASGKTTVAEDYVNGGHLRLNRDPSGGRVADLVPDMVAALKSGKDVVLLDILVDFLSVDGDFPRSLDSQFNLLALNFDYGDLNVIADGDRFALLSG